MAQRNPRRGRGSRAGQRRRPPRSSQPPAGDLVALHGLSPNDAQQALAAADPSVSLASLRQYVTTAQEAALPLLTALTAAPPEHLAAAAAEALGDLPSPAAARLAEKVVATADSRPVRRGARRARFRLHQAGIDPAPTSSPSEAAAVDEAALAAAGKTAFLGSCDSRGGRLIWLELDVPAEGRVLADGLIYDTGRIEAFTVTPMSRSELERAVAQRTAEIETEQRFLVTDFPVAYIIDFLASVADEAIEQRRGVPPDYAVYRRHLKRPTEPPAAPIYSHLGAAEVRFRPDLLGRSPDVLDDDALRGWYLEAEVVQPLVELRQKTDESLLALPPAAQAERESAAQRQIVEAEFGGNRIGIWRRRLEEMAYHLIRHDRTEMARLALAAALEFDPAGSAPHDHPWVERLIRRSVAVLLGEAEPEEQPRPEQQAGLWTPR